jgi:hypothetical protein
MDNGPEFVYNEFMKSQKLKIRLPSDNEAQDTCTLEEAVHRFNWGHEPFVVVVEGEFVPSFDDLIALSKQDRFKDREFLEVDIQPLLAGG